MTLAARQLAYDEATTTFLDALALVTEATIDRRQPDGWSARQVVHHMADSEAQSYARLRRLLAEPAGSLIAGYDEGAWAENVTLGYNELPIDASVAVVKAVRAASSLLVHRLTASDLLRAGTHSESGAYTVDDWLTIYTQHPLDHAAQLLEALRA